MKGLLYGFIGGLTFSVLLTFITTYFISAKSLSTKKIVKFYSAFCFFVLGFGFVEFFIQKLAGGMPAFIYCLFNNERLLLGHLEVGINSTYVAQRIQSIFSEPSSFGEFLYLNAPIIYAISMSRFKIFKHPIVNFCIKKLLLLLLLVCFILVQSPMTFIIFLTVTFFYFFKKIVLFIKKYFITCLLPCLILLILSLLTIEQINLDNTFLRRIIVSVPALFNLEKLIEADPSLATRISDNINAILISLKFPILGIGYGNITKYIFVQLNNTPLPLTPELATLLVMQNGSPPFGLFYRYLAETGFVGIGILYLFFIKILLLIKRTVKNMIPCIEKDFLHGIFGSILVYITLSAFYNSSLHKTSIFMSCAFAIYICINKSKTNNQ